MRKTKQQLKQQTPFSFMLFAFALICALALAGCGGGGGGSAAVMPSPDPMPGGGQQTPDSSEDQEMTGGGSTPPQQTMREGTLFKEVNEDPELANGAAVRILRAARSRPIGRTITGGISSTTQSSYSFEGRTVDQHTVVPEIDENQELHITRIRRILRNNTTFTVSTTDPRATFHRLNGIPAEGWRGMEGFGEASNGIFNWDAYTDIENAGDTDYQSLAIWLYIFKDSDTGALGSGYTLGGAATGNDPFEHDNLAGLTGTANYEGPAIGMHMMKANADATPVYDHFSAKAYIEVNFGDSTERGTATGMITEGMTEGGIALPDLTLESADIFDAGGGGHGGNFRGVTSGTTSGGASLSGMWGGKIYGNGANATDLPTTVGGTFGGNTDDELQSFIGAFSAYKQ